MSDDWDYACHQCGQIRCGCRENEKIRARLQQKPDALKLAREVLEQPVRGSDALTLARTLIEQAAEIEKLRARLNPTPEEHDANPAQYWDRELERDERGLRVPRLADCDWPKHHLRIALAANVELKAALREAIEVAENLPQINDWGPDPDRMDELRRLL